MRARGRPQPPRTAEQITRGAVTERTRQVHDQWKRWVRRGPAPTIVEFERMAAERGWAPTTKRTYWGNILGAAARYAPTFRQDPMARDQTRRIEHAALQHEPAYPEPATKREVLESISWLKRRGQVAEAAFLATVWATAARFSDVTRLRRANMDVSHGRLRVTFVEGKGVLARGAPYTVHTLAGPLGGLWSNPVMAQREPFKDVDTKKVLDALKKSDPHLEARSLRRGALEQLASTGATEDTLRAFSGHTNPKQLLRYLRWGRAFANQQQRTEMAAKALW